MTFPPLDTLDPPQYNGYSNNATRKPRDPSPSTTTTTSPPSRPPRTYSNNSRPRTISTTTSSIGGGQGMPAVKRSDVPTEFYISVELYLPPKASIGLRKVRSSFPPLSNPRLSHSPRVKYFIIDLIIHLDAPFLSLFSLPAVLVGPGLRIQPVRKRSAEGRRLKGVLVSPSFCALLTINNFLQIKVVGFLSATAPMEALNGERLRAG